MIIVSLLSSNSSLSLTKRLPIQSRPLEVMCVSGEAGVEERRNLDSGLYLGCSVLE